MSARMRDPFSESSALPENLTLREEEELCEGQSDSTWEMRFTDLLLTSSGFCEEEYPGLHRKSRAVLVPFSASYMYEQAFTCVTRTKSPDINGLTSVGKSVCTDLRFDQEFSIHAVKRKNYFIINITFFNACTCL